MARRDYGFEQIVMLALMRLGEDAYGVPISREIEETIEREVPLASVYATLERVESKRLVSSELGERTPQHGGRAKKYFHVTGKNLLRTSVATPPTSYTG